MAVSMKCSPGRFYLYIVVLACISGSCVEGFASMMTKDFCDRELSVGTIIMKQSVVANSERSIVVKSSSGAGEEIQEPYLVNPGEQYVLEMLPKTPQVVFQVAGLGASFHRGKCHEQRRSSERTAVLQLSPQSQGNITVAAVWATSYSGGVQLAPPVVLQTTGQTRSQDLVSEEAGAPQEL